MHHSRWPGGISSVLRATPETIGAGSEMFTENGPAHLDLGMTKEFTVS